MVGRDFPARQLTTRWHGDGTPIRTDQGRLHLVSVLDMTSRRMLGFALGDRHAARLTYSALAMAVAVCGGSVPGVIFHTGRGSEYTARVSAQPARSCPSTSRWAGLGPAPDNALIEVWNSSLEFELRAPEHSATQAATRAWVAAWIDDYNRNRRHSALRMRSSAH